MCEFCELVVVDKDDLKRHMRDKHLVPSKSLSPQYKKRKQNIVAIDVKEAEKDIEMHDLSKERLKDVEMKDVSSKEQSGNIETPNEKNIPTMIKTSQHELPPYLRKLPNHVEQIVGDDLMIVFISNRGRWSLWAKIFCCMDFFKILP